MTLPCKTVRYCAYAEPRLITAETECWFVRARGLFGRHVFETLMFAEERKKKGNEICFKKKIFLFLSFHTNIRQPISFLAFAVRVLFHIVIFNFSLWAPDLKRGYKRRSERDRESEYLHIDVDTTNWRANFVKMRSQFSIRGNIYFPLREIYECMKVERNEFTSFIVTK